MGVTDRHGFPWPNGTDLVAQGDDAIHALADAIDAAIATDNQGTTLPSPGITGRYFWKTDTGELWRDDGAAWQRIGLSAAQRGAVTGSSGTPSGSNRFVTEADPRMGSQVTALPSSPVDGQLIDFVVAEGVVWRFRYRAADPGPYRWVFMGGPPLRAEVDTTESVATDAYSSLTTDGPAVTPPLAGEYDLAYGCNARNDTAGGGAAMSPRIPGGSGTAVDADRVLMETPGGATWITLARTDRRVITPATQIRLRYRRLNAVGTATFEQRWLTVTPMRVG